MAPEFIRLAVLYAHLIACCFALSMVLTSDITTIKQLLGGQEVEALDRNHLNTLQVTVLRSLIALWVTGIAIITVDYWAKGGGYFANPKLQAKVAIVCLLTLNGLLLHKYVLPAMNKAGSLLKMDFNPRMLAIFAGAVSGASWLYAAMLGVGRALAWKYSMAELLTAYLALIVGGFLAMALLTSWVKYRHSGAKPGSSDFEVTSVMVVLR